jgi:hypothetical protein
MPARLVPGRGFLACLLGLAARTLCAEAWYESNSLGIPLREIAPGERSGLEYTLRVDTAELRETRTLFSEEEGEIRRWERRRSESGFLEEETLYKDGVKDSVTAFSPTGQIKSEILFIDGKEDGRFLFDYAVPPSGEISAGVPLKVTFSRTEGNAGFRDEYLYLPSGDFRGVKRVYGDGSVYTSIFTSDRGTPREEWHSFGGLEIIFRYDNRGSVLYQEEYRDSVLVERVDFRYDAETHVEVKGLSMRFPISVITSAINSSITPELIYGMYVNLFPSYIIWVFPETDDMLDFTFSHLILLLSCFRGKYRSNFSVTN